MKNNSILNSIKGSDSISEIILLLNEPSQIGNVYFVVEGPFDSRLFKGKVNNKVEIIISHCGKPGVLKTIRYFSTDNKVIGICDYDYNGNLGNNKIFTYDYCCAEMMIISNLEVFKQILLGLNIEIDKVEELRYAILKEISFLSYIRKINSDKNLKLDLDESIISRCINKENSKLDKELLIEAIVNKNKKINIENNNEIFKLANDCQDNSSNLLAYLNITNGHDFSNYLFFSFKEQLPKGKQMIRKESIENIYITSYRLDDFKKTNLYNNIKNYFNSYSLIVFN